MSENTLQSKKQKSGKSQIIGIRFPEEIAVAIKQEAARRNIRLNRLIQEMWEKYQEEKQGS
jgi:predicted DNA binding CopG/RHH family protein